MIVAALLTNASSTRLQNAALSLTNTGYPCTMACWVNPDTSGVLRTFAIVADTGTTNNYLLLQTVAGGSWAIGAAAGGTNSIANGGTTTANQWAFVLGRFINATNRRISVLQYDGSIIHAQSTTSRAPTGLDSVAIGGRITSSPDQFFGGFVGEFWYTDTDIQPGGAQLENALLMKLALGGPFSVPHVAKSLVEYRSLRTGLDSAQDRPEEIWYRGLWPTWTNTNGVTLGPHPPLPGWYQKPGNVIRPAVV